MNENISINPETGGIDPHVLACEACGDEYGLSVGQMKTAVYKLPDGSERSAYADRLYVHKAKTSLRKIGAELVTNWTLVPESERVIKMGLCDKCEAQIGDPMQDPDVAAAVKAGGVLFKCDECNQSGAIIRSSRNKDFCDEVRSQNGVELGEPCGITFDKCSQHGEGDA